MSAQPAELSHSSAEVPVLRPAGPGRLAACHRAEEVLAGLELPDLKMSR